MGPTVLTMLTVSWDSCWCEALAALGDRSGQASIAAKARWQATRLRLRAVHRGSARRLKRRAACRSSSGRARLQPAAAKA